MDLINDSVRAILILVPKFGSTFLPTYFGKLKHPDNVMSAIMYCKDIDKCKQWAEGYKVVKHFENDILQLQKVVENEIVKALSSSE